MVEEGKKAAVAVETISVSLFLFNSFNCVVHSDPKSIISFENSVNIVSLSVI